MGYVDVFLNGVKLTTSDYTASNGTSVVLGVAAALNDIVEIIAWTVLGVTNTNIGIGTGTSLALGGATIGTNALAVTGTTALSGLLTAAGGVSSTLTTDATSASTGSIITAGGISTQKALWVGTTSRLVGNTQHDGLVGIGMTPTNVLDITQNQNATSTVSILNSNASTAAFSRFFTSNGTNFTYMGTFGTGYTTNAALVANRGFIGTSDTLVVCAATNQIIFASGGIAEVARFDTSGNLLVGGTSGGRIASWDTAGTTSLYLRSSAVATHMMEIINTNSNGGAAITFQYFQTVYGAAGTIVCTTTNTAYNTSSDYRMKENVQPMTGGLSTIAALKPVIFDWIPSKTAGEGFIAHELQAVIPAAVSGEKDALYEDGSINAQGVDFGKIVPHLVVAIQELTARLEALEAK